MNKVTKRKIDKGKRLYAVVRGRRGKKTFKKWHDDQTDAWEEANRLAMKEGGLFLIVEAKAVMIGGKPREDEEDNTQ